MPFPRYWYLGQLVVYFIGGIGFASSGVINIAFNAGRRTAGWVAPAAHTASLASQ